MATTEQDSARLLNDLRLVVFGEDGIGPAGVPGYFDTRTGQREPSLVYMVRELYERRRWWDTTLGKIFGGLAGGGAFLGGLAAFIATVTQVF